MTAARLVFPALSSPYSFDHLAHGRPAPEQTGKLCIEHRDPPQHIEQPLASFAGRNHDYKPMHAGRQFGIGNNLARVAFEQDCSFANYSFAWDTWHSPPFGPIHDGS